MPSLAFAATILAESLTLLGGTMYVLYGKWPSAYHKQQTANKLKGYVWQDLTAILHEASRENLAPEHIDSREFAESVRSGLIAGYEGQTGPVPSFSGNAFLQFSFQRAELYGEVAYKILETPSTRGMMNPRRLGLDEVVEAARKQKVF